MSQDLVQVAPVDALPATPEERLAALDTAAREYVRTQRPANTQRAYAADWKVWTRYVAELGIPEDSATAGALVGIVVLEHQEVRPPRPWTAAWPVPSSACVSEARSRPGPPQRPPRRR